MKATDEAKDLLRSAARLAALDGALVVARDGPVLLSITGVAAPTTGRPSPESLSKERISPRSVALEAYRHGAPTIRVLRHAFATRRETPVDAQLLSAARRDLRRLSSQEARDRIRREPRPFRRHGVTAEGLSRWLEARGRRLDEIARALGEPSSPGLAAVLRVVEAVRGPDVEERTRAIVSATLAREARDVERATARLEAVRAAFETDGEGQGEGEGDDDAREVAAAIRALERLPGRARARKIAQRLRALPGVALERTPDVPAHLPLREQLAEAVRRFARALVAARPEDFAERATTVIATFALMVRGRRSPTAMEDALSVAQIVAAQDRVLLVSTQLADVELDPLEAILLAGLSIEPGQLRKLGRWVQEGLPVARVVELARGGGLAMLLEHDGDGRAAARFAEWTAVLVPHYSAMGIELAIAPSILRDVRASREELAILAQCLVEHHAAPDAAAIERQLSALDATLALFERAPARVRSAIDEVRAVTAGEGRARFPAFAAFLGDDARLDRFIHLSRLAGQEPSLSEALQEDARLFQSFLEQLRHLEALGDPTDVQLRRIDTLRASLAEPPPSPERTLRRLDARIAALLPRAYGAVLDRVLGEVLREAWDIAPRAMTPAWRDAVRFFLTLDDNREHLRTLLRHAAAHPGAPIAETLPKNNRFIVLARVHFEIDAFLRPRRREITLGDARYVIALEDDPVEVLRMGIPFDTCLSLTDGVNAASTVLNAMDANKRVLYVRDAKGTIVARKLLAISKNEKLLGYRLYQSIDDPSGALAAAVTAFCRELATEAELPLADTGQPARIHAGFWYDDVPVPWGAESDGATLAAYAATLGRPYDGGPVPERFAIEARRHAALASNDVERMIAEVPTWVEGLGDARLQDRIVELLTLRSAIARVAQVDDLAPAIARSLLRRSGALADFATLAVRSGAADVRTMLFALAEAVRRCDDDGRALGPLIGLVRRVLRAKPTARTRGVEHVIFELSRHARRAELSVLLDEAPAIDDLFATFVAREPGCAQCRERARRELEVAACSAFARAPDPDAVLRVLRDRRASSLALSMAIAIAAEFPLDRDRSFGLYEEPRGVGRVPSAVAAIARVAERSSREALLPETEPLLFAAFLRQGGSMRPRGASPKPPLPTVAPFEALRDLASLDEVAAFVSGFAAFDVATPLWSPGPFELHHHRMHDTPWKRLLRARAEAGDGCAASWLAILGDVEGLEHARATDGGKVAWRRRMPLARAVAAGGDVVAQHVLAEVDAERWPLEAIDVTQVHAALARLASGASDEPRAGSALDVLEAAQHRAWEEALGDVAARVPAKEPWIAQRVARFLDRRVQRAKSPETEGIAWEASALLARAGHGAAVVRALAIGATESFDPLAARARAVWTRVTSEAEADALLAAWIREAIYVGSGPVQVTSSLDEGLRDVALQAVAAAPSDRVRAALVDEEDWAALSRLVDLLAARGRLGEILPVVPDNEQGRVLRKWMEAAGAAQVEARA